MKLEILHYSHGLPRWYSGKKNPPANAEGTGDSDSMMPGSERPPGVGNGNPLQYSCLENPKDRGAWCGGEGWGALHSMGSQRVRRD